MTFQKFLLNSGLMLITIITFSTANNGKYDTAVDYNLQDYAVPLHYNVELRYLLQDNILFGECSIIINISRSLRSIKMHSVPITIIDAALIDSKKTVYELTSSSFVEENVLNFIFDEQLLNTIHPDVYTLNVTYLRMINDNSAFGHVYPDKRGMLKIIETDVEIIKASQLFPCREERAIKSTFKIAIKHHGIYKFLSIMPIRIKYRDYKTMIWTDFEKSPLMSAHYLVIVMTTFTKYEIRHYTNLTIWCRQHALRHTDYTQKVIEKIVPYFRQKYLMELSKLDIVALWHPEDDIFVTSGLFLLKEEDIIYNEELHSFIRKRKVERTIARQLAFLWCNNVLLWSKNGFTTFFGAYILDEVYKNRYTMDLMVAEAQESLRYDISSIINSTVNSLVSPSNDIKSFLIWRMLYHIMPDVFWIGIRKYIDKYRDNRNTTSDDLWAILRTTHLEIFPNKSLHFFLNNVTMIMNNWITQQYYPVLKVSRNLNMTVEINYRQSNQVSEKVEDWMIPVTYTTQSFLSFTNANQNLFWLSSRNLRHLITEINESDWIIVNIQQIGYYRVSYDFKNWHKLMCYLNSENYKNIHILNRAKIIDDAFYFLLHKQISYNMFWYVTSFVLRDTNFITWHPMFKIFESIMCIFPPQYGNDTMQKMKNTIDRLLIGIGYFKKPTDHFLITYLREEAIKWACFLNVPECRRIAASELKKELQGSIENTNLMRKRWIYYYGLATANETTWSNILFRYKATYNVKLLEYLTFIEDNVLTCNYLKLLIEKSFEDVLLLQHAKIILLLVAKHAKNDVVHCILLHLPNVKFNYNSNWKTDIIATLIVIITHMQVYSEDHSTKIIDFIKQYEEDYIKHTKGKIYKAVKEKIRKRRLEYERLIRENGYYLSDVLKH